MLKSTVLMQKTCRTCLKDSDLFISAFQIKQSNSNNITLSEMLLECTSVHVSSTDKLPTLICEKCALLIINYYDFKIMCRETQKKLEEIITENNKIELSNENVDNFIENVSNTEICDKELQIVKDVPNYPFKCKECDKSFRLETNLIKHINRIHSKNIGEKILKCNYCNRTFKSKIHLKKHINQDKCNENQKEMQFICKTDEEVLKEYGCQVCNKIFSSKGDLRIHTTNSDCAKTKKEPTVKELKEYMCPSCSDMFTTMANLRTHIIICKQKDNEEIHKCQICLSKFQNENDLQDHILKEHNGRVDDKHTYPNQETKEFICKLCKRSYRKQSNYTRHLQTHLGEDRKYKCSNIDCDARFSTAWALSEHEKVAHTDAIMSDKQSKPTCDKCGKVFEQNKYLMKHMYVHSKQRPHLCTVCGKAFSLAGNLKSHMRIHSGEKPYVCKTCNRAFSQWSSLRYHMSVHKDKRDNVCAACGLAFARRYSMLAHVRAVHMGERPHCCSICDKKFSTSNALKTHMAVHSGVKDHKCDYCGKTFGRSYHLKVHEMTHTGERPHICIDCGQSFIQYHCLTAHVRKHHQNQSQTQT